MGQKREILNYMNIFRAIAIIIIVAGHCFIFENARYNIIGGEIFACGTVLFVFISGFLFKYLADNFDYKKYLDKKLINVILPYIITSIPGIIMCFCIADINPFISLPKIQQIFIFLTTGIIHNPPTWYIPMTSLLFLAAPIFLKLESISIKKYKLLYLLLPFFILLSIIFPKTGISPYTLNSMTNIGLFTKYLICLKVIIVNFLDLLFVYVLGMYFASKRDCIETLFEKKIPLIIMMIVCAASDITISYNYNYQNVAISKTFLTLILLGYLKHYDSVIKNNNLFNKIANFIAQYSFGIFFLHCYFRRLIKIVFEMINLPVKIILTDFYSSITSILCVIIIFLFTFGSSVLCCYLIKTLVNKIGIKNSRAIIGV